MAERQYNRYLGYPFRGVDFSSHPSMVATDRFSDAKNMWRDYEAGQGAAVESFPGFRCLKAWKDKRIWGIFRWRIDLEDYLLIHAGTGLWIQPLADRDLDQWKQVDCADMAEHKSSGFQYGACFYVLDGAHYYKLTAERVLSDKGLAVASFSAASAAGQYVPCTYLNGVEYEQRNMLTDRFEERYIIGDPTAYRASADLLTYEVIDADTCRVSSVADTAYGVIYVPATATVNGKTYNVVSVGKGAFFGKNVSVIYFSSGLTGVGTLAFAQCSSLRKVSFPSEMEVVGQSAFSGCFNLKEVYFGAKTLIIGANAFPASINVTKIYLAAASESDVTIGSENEAYARAEIIYGCTDPNFKELSMHFSLHEKVLPESDLTVHLDGVQISAGLLAKTTDTVAQEGKTYYSVDGIPYEGLIGKKRFLLLPTNTGGKLTVVSANYENILQLGENLELKEGLYSFTIFLNATGAVRDMLGKCAVINQRSNEILCTLEWKVMIGGSGNTNIRIEKDGAILLDGFVGKGGNPSISFNIKDISEMYEDHSESGTFYTATEREGLITEITLTCSDGNDVSGKTLSIHGYAEEAQFSTAGHRAFLSTVSDYGGTSAEAILGCAVVAQYDGRIFFTGNPMLPNTVFYTQRDLTGHNNPMYFGSYNFFETGVGSSPNVAMVAASSALLVLKNDTVQDGSINCYQGVDGGDDLVPRIYVRTQGLPGIGCLGAACNFADDPVFVTTRGLDAVGTQTVNLERTVQHRSSNVDRRLIAEDLKGASLTEWKGYLVLLCPNGHVYLADSRQTFTHSTGGVEYEWYYLDGFGAHVGDSSVYRYSAQLTTFEADKGYTVNEDQQGEPVQGTVYSEEDDGGQMHYYEGETHHACHLTDEKSGGAFDPASCIRGIDELLFFGTESGALCVVNTDKRGLMPTDEMGGEVLDMTEEEYAALYGDVIARQWYSHAGHAVEYVLRLASDNAGIPHMTKSTVRKSCVVRIKDMFGSDFCFDSRTDRETYLGPTRLSASGLDFSDVEFASLLFHPSQDGSIVPLSEKRRKWVEKQYVFYSIEHCRPFGLYGIAYQYYLQGRVKNR